MRVIRWQKFVALAALACAAIVARQAPAAIIFDDFNVNEGHFNQAPNFSGTTVGEDVSSTADRVETDGPLEGAGHQKLVLVHDTTTTAFRLRHVSGSGTPANNTSFTTTSGTDGWIGFYLKTTATGWETSINLDGAGNTAAEMDGSLSTAVIGDGQWHLYEWNLDAVTGWGAVPGIGGGHGGALLNGSHTIDSIYLRDLDGSPGPTATFFLDFVAKSDSGSIAGLIIPEPTTLLLAGVALVGACAVSRRKIG
jgi:hypothetical protein